jgi:hypothetical protein
MSKPNWIKDAIKQPGKLKSKMGMKKPMADEEPKKMPAFFGKGK